MNTPPLSAQTISLSLAYCPSFDWHATLDWLEARAIPGVEAVTRHRGGCHVRSVHLEGHGGCITIDAAPEADSLRVEVPAALQPVVAQLMMRVGRQFDVDAEPQRIGAHLAADPRLAPLVAKRPGLRLQGAFDAFELAWRAVLGQQVTVRAATTLAGRLVRLLAEPLPDAPVHTLTHRPLHADRLADASVAAIQRIGLPRTRAGTLVALARAVADGELPELANHTNTPDPVQFMQRFMALPGIGPWTAEYVALRALRCTDAFPAADLGLRKAMGGMSARDLIAAAEPWRPFRAYAAHHLWASLADGS